NDHVGVLEIPQHNEELLINISQHIHETFHRCGGYKLHEDKNEAMKVLELEAMKNNGNEFDPFPATLLTFDRAREDFVRDLFTQVEELNIRNTIAKMSGFNN